MIRNDAEYTRALERLEQEQERLSIFEKQFSEEFPPDQVARLMEPLMSFREQLVDEVRVYERLKRGDLGDLTNLRGLGRLLIHLRISRGITQRQLAERLDVSESQVSRDERNEYHGITMDRAARILDAMGAKLLSSVVEPAGATLDRTSSTWSPPAPKVRESARADCGKTVTPTRKVLNADAAADAA
jgi:transcriptional regulator with XRE-family HTH domain